MGIKLKKIFENEWDDFVRISKSSELKRDSVHTNVWKMIHCKTPWMGLQIYQCKKHPGETKVLPCTCKSRFCPSCGYKANLVWLNGLLSRVFPCDHQHLVFTLPYELREAARYNRRVIFRLMSQSISGVIKDFISQHKSLDYIPAGVSILHTFGKGLKWHIHFHVLLAAGGISKKDHKTWIDNTYLNENFLKKAWKAKLLRGLRKLYKKGELVNVPKDFRQMLSNIYEKNWYVWLKTVEGDTTFSFIYIGRYAKRACISQKGIIYYQKHRLIRWKEMTNPDTPAHCANQTSTHKFIDLLIQHIPDKYDHQIFYFGLYTSYYKNKEYRKAKKHLQRRLKKSGSIITVLKRIKLTFSRLMQWTHNYDPLSCTKCKEKLGRTGIVFFSPLNPRDKGILSNYEVRDYTLVKKADTS